MRTSLENAASDLKFMNLWLRDISALETSDDGNDLIYVKFILLDRKCMITSYYFYRNALGASFICLPTRVEPLGDSLKQLIPSIKVVFECPLSQCHDPCKHGKKINIVAKIITVKHVVKKTLVKHKWIENILRLIIYASVEHHWSLPSLHYGPGLSPCPQRSP